MSFRAMSWAVKQKLPTHAKFVLLILSSYAGPDGASYPSIARLAEDTGLSERSVIRAIQTLEARGYLSIRKLPPKNKSNVYILNIEENDPSILFEEA